MWAIFDSLKSSKVPYYCSPPSLFGHVWRKLFNKHSENMDLKSVFDRMFLKHLIENNSETF